MNLVNNLHHITQQITQAELVCHRKPGSVLLLAVTKKQPAPIIRQAFELGIHDFGESYVQEAHQKIIQLHDLPICWHFIGPVQSNKTKQIASHFTWVHSISKIKTAELLNKNRPDHLGPLNVCLQINLVNEATKSGIPPSDALKLAQAVSQLPRLTLRGLMTIPPPTDDEKKQVALFAQLNTLSNTINQQLQLNMDTLSMGMSDDMACAIKAGATIVRIGRALFGERVSVTH